MFESRFLDNGSTDSQNVYSFGNTDSGASFPPVQPIKTFWLLDLENGAQVVYELHSWLVLIFSENAKASSLKI